VLRWQMFSLEKTSIVIDIKYIRCKVILKYVCMFNKCSMYKYVMKYVKLILKYVCMYVQQMFSSEQVCET